MMELELEGEDMGKVTSVCLVVVRGIETMCTCLQTHWNRTEVSLGGREADCIWCQGS